MTRAEMLSRFSCMLSLESAILVADHSQQKHGNRVQMVVVQWEKFFVVFNQVATSKDFEVLRSLPVVYRADVI